MQIRPRKLLFIVPIVALMLGTVLPAVADGGVEPPIVTGSLAPGESMTITKTVTTPGIPPVVDIFLLEDETGSFCDDIATLKGLASEIWDAISDSGTDFTMGVGGFRDFGESPWGYPDDWVYRRLTDLTNDKNAFIEAVDILTAGAGGDCPEAQLEALHYLAVPEHPAIDSNGDGVTTGLYDTPMGQQPAWRDGAQRVVLLATDAECHVMGDTATWPKDAGVWPGDEGTASADVTAEILADAGITVIGLTPNGAGELPQIDILASATGGSVHATTSSGDNIKNAILAGLEELSTDVWWEVTSCDEGLTVALTPEVHHGVKGGTSVEFEETISIVSDLELQCNMELGAKVTFYANGYPQEGTVIGTQTITIIATYEVEPSPEPDPEPKLGFVTGGGWIALGDNSGDDKGRLEKGTFGFVARYDNDELVKGQVQFNAPDLRFHSTSVDFLEFSHDRGLGPNVPDAEYNCAKITGKGRLNGESGYCFTVTVIDRDEPGGGSDEFHITISTTEQSDDVVVGDVLGSGNIQMH